MKVMAPQTNNGRTVAIDDVHHRTADQSRERAAKSAKALKHAARQDAKRQIGKEVEAND